MSLVSSGWDSAPAGLVNLCQESDPVRSQMKDPTTPHMKVDDSTSQNSSIQQY